MEQAVTHHPDFCCWYVHQRWMHHATRLEGVVQHEGRNHPSVAAVHQLMMIRAACTCNQQPALPIQRQAWPYLQAPQVLLLLAGHLGGSLLLCLQFCLPGLQAPLTILQLVLPGCRHTTDAVAEQQASTTRCRPRPSWPPAAHMKLSFSSCTCAGAMHQAFMQAWQSVCCLCAVCRSCYVAQATPCRHHPRAHHPGWPSCPSARRCWRRCAR